MIEDFFMFNCAKNLILSNIPYSIILLILAKQKDPEKCLH